MIPSAPITVVFDIIPAGVLSVYHFPDPPMVFDGTLWRTASRTKSGKYVFVDSNVEREGLRFFLLRAFSSYYKDPGLFIVHVRTHDARPRIYSAGVCVGDGVDPDVKSIVTQDTWENVARRAESYILSMEVMLS